MPIAKIQDFCVTVIILGNKTDTYFVKSMGVLLTNLKLQHTSFTIQVAKMVPNLHI